MTRHKLPTMILILFFSFFFLQCKKEGHMFRVKADTLIVPDVVSAHDTLKIRVRGYVGPNGCHSFSHIKQESKKDNIRLKLWGKVSGEDICTLALVYFDEVLPVTALTPGNFIVIVEQPDKTELRDTVVVN